MFTRVIYFGFSKRMDETLEHWGKDLVLGDVVHAVRRYRPDIIISRFHGKPRDGHGNHQTAGLMSAEVFRAAADPNAFPEHFKEGLHPWQVQKLYRSVREPEPSTLKVDVGAFDSLTGRSYREIARDGLAHQRSQGAGTARVAPGSAISSWLLEEESLVGNREKELSIFDGLDTTILGLEKLAGPARINAELTALNDSIEAAIRKFDARQPWLVAPDLATGMDRLRTVYSKVKNSSLDETRKDHLLFLLGNKENEFNEAMNKALGLAMEVLVDPKKTAEGLAAFFQSNETINVAIPGQKFSLTATVVNRSPVLILPDKLRLAQPRNWPEASSDQAEPASLGMNGKLQAKFIVSVPESAEHTRPYWSRANELRDHIYRIDNPEHLGLPFAPPEVVGICSYRVDGVGFWLHQPAQTVYIDRPWGEQRRLLTIAPAMSVALSPRVGVVSITATDTTFNASVNIMNNASGNAVGKVRLKLPQGWRAMPAEAPFSFTHEGEQGNFSFKDVVPRVAAGTEYKIQAVAEFNNKEYTEGYQIIAHRDNEPRHLYRPATMDVRGIEVKVAPGLNVGYVMGVGDEVPKALEQIGVKVTMLGESDLANGNLDAYDTILIGIRATAVRDDLKAYSKRLLEYCERGGNLIYQYQTQEFDDALYGPYPYKLGGRAEEVSEEDSKVTILDPANPVFNWPNKITEADFNGWVEERGSKWMSTWDERYQPLLECNDRQQEPQKGGMMYAQYGKGTFVYAAYAFYRQLPAGVRGGYRLFANVISLKKRPR